MNLLCSLNIETRNGQSLQKRQKRIKETSDVEKKQDQTMNKKPKYTKIASKNTICQDSTREEFVTKNKNRIITTIQPSPGTLYHDDEKETREETKPKLSQTIQSQSVSTPTCSDQSNGTEHARIWKEKIEFSV
jgi:hypothetical protein